MIDHLFWWMQENPDKNGFKILYLPRYKAYRVYCWVGESPNFERYWRSYHEELTVAINVCLEKIRSNESNYVTVFGEYEQ